MQIARGQFILFMDADGATKISDIQKLEAELKRISRGDHVLTSHQKARIDFSASLPSSDGAE